MKSYVYIHKRATDGKIFYVGKGSKNRLKSNQQRNKWWHNVVNKHGFNAEIIQEFDNEDLAFSYEKELIEILIKNNETLVNIKDGGKGGKGFSHSNEAKEKISEAGRNRIWKQESKDKISKTLTGSTFSRKRKRKFPSNNRKTVVCLDTGDIFYSTHEASFKLNLNYSNIAAVCRGLRQTCGGLRFVYK